MTEYFTKDGDDFKKVDEELLTEQQVNSVVKGRAERIASSQYSDYDDLKKKSSEFDSKLKSLTEEKSVIETELGKAKLETEKVRVISEFKLSDELAEFVTGESADELRQRAEKLSKGVTGGTVTIDKKGKPEEKATDSKAIAGRLFGKKSDD